LLRAPTLVVAEARAFARTLGLRTGEDWDPWCRIPGNRPPDIPANPEIKYRSDGWRSYADFLQSPPNLRAPPPWF
jgi:hypothetical protein